MKTKVHQKYVAENHVAQNQVVETNKKRQRLIVSYHLEDCFRLREGLDLNDKTVVHSWGVKYGTLRISYQSGEEEEIQSEGWVSDFDFKYHNEQRLEDDDDDDE